MNFYCPSLNRLNIIVGHTTQKLKKGRAKLNSLGQHFNTARTLVPLSEQFIVAFQVRAVEKINPVSTHNTVQR